MSESYVYLNDEVVNSLEGSGCESLIQLLQAPDQTSEQVEEVSSQIFTEFILLYEDNKVSKEAILNFLSLAIKEESYAVIFCQVLDVFPLSQCIQDLLLEIYKKQSIIKYSTLAKYIDSESLAKASIVPSDILNRQLNTRKRDDFYTQKKYNLLHEELEGYSKLIVELFIILKGEDTNYQIDYALNVIESSIGHYSLDPNRVLDILMDIYSNNFVGNHDFAITLLRKSRWWPKTESDCTSSIENLSIGGNESAAKCIGLKLLKHPKDKDLPETFKILIACLLKEGFISFGSIWKYVRPEKEDMDTLHADYKKELDSQVFKASASALALAAPLADEEMENKTLNSSNLKSQVKSAPATLEEKLHVNLKFQFLKAFLGNGLYWPSIYILTEYPFMVHLSTEVPELMGRMFEHMIAPLYNKISPFDSSMLSQLQTAKKVAFSKPLNTVRYEDFQCTEFLSFKPTIKSFSLKKFHYFYTQWSDRLPDVKTVDDLFKTSREFLKFMDVTLSQDLEIFTKICDIAVWDLNKNSSESRKLHWFDYFRNYIYPSIPLIKENSFAVDKAYEILKYFSLEERFNLYSEMHQVLSKNNPHIKMAYGKAEKSTKDVLKRLSKENVRPMMRRLAKISFSNPLPCFLTILQQIESYDNLNTLVVETARYFNGYGWDVLVLAILLRLTASGRSNIQVDGLNDRQWIQSLASFIGKICQRYPNYIDLKTLLKFLLKSFSSKETAYIIVLKEIFISMGGIQTITNLTLQQVNMISCGSTLEKVVYKTIDDSRFERFKSGSILIKCLDELNANNEVLVLLCQLSDYVVFDSDHSHLKVLTNKNEDLDTLLHLFTQLVSFFGDGFEMTHPLLPISEFVRDYNVPTQWAYEIWRPFLKESISKSAEVEGKNLVLEELKEQSYCTLPQETWKNLSTEIYTTFWQLSLYDINFSESLYTGEQEKLRSVTRRLLEAISINKKDRDVSRATSEKSKKDLKENEDFVKNLPSELKIHVEHYTKVMERLAEESKVWFPNSGTDAIELQTRSFLQFCVLPRAINSPFDAAYTAKFIFKLHELEALNFSIISIFDVLVKSEILFGTLFTLTPSEAENLGLFFADLLKTLNEMSTPSVFDKTNVIDTDTSHSLNYDEYRLRLFDYHTFILNDVEKAFEVEEYMCRRNAITFMKNLLGVYPIVEDHCEKVISWIENIAKNESREDLKLSSSALIGHIKSRSKNWVHLWDFIPLSESDKEAHIAKRNEVKESLKKVEQEKRDATKKAEELKNQEILKVRLEQEESNKQKKLASALSYEDSGNTAKRAESRGSEGSKDRHDYYSKYEKQKDLPQVAKAESEDLIIDKEEQISDKKDTEKDIEIDKVSDIAKKNRASDLKAKLLEAKREYKESRSRDFSPGSESKQAISTDKDNGKLDEAKFSKRSTESPKLPAHQASQGLNEAATTKPRMPLPPQPSTKLDTTYTENQRRNVERPAYGSQNSRYINQRLPKAPSTRPPTTSNFNRQSTASAPAPRSVQRSTLPPPPPPLNLKQTRNDGGNAANDINHRSNHRYDAKRKQDNYGSGRTYDKKLKY